MPSPGRQPAVLAVRHRPQRWGVLRVFVAGVDAGQQRLDAGADFNVPAAVGVDTDFNQCGLDHVGQREAALQAGKQQYQLQCQPQHGVSAATGISRHCSGMALVRAGHKY